MATSTPRDRTAVHAPGQGPQLAARRGRLDHGERRADRRRPRPRSGARGWSLVELTAALAILALLLGLGAPAYSQWLAETRVANLAHALANAIDRARSEAIKHGGRATLCKSADRRSCTTGGGWEAGWLLFLDDDADGAPDADEIVVGTEPAAASGLTARANQPLANYVSFTAFGHARLLSGALQMGRFTVCRSGQRAYHVVLANSGRVRVDRTADRCP